jgi:hypothetical protein
VYSKGVLLVFPIGADGPQVNQITQAGSGPLLRPHTPARRMRPVRPPDPVGRVEVRPVFRPRRLHRDPPRSATRLKALVEQARRKLTLLATTWLRTHDLESPGNHFTAAGKHTPPTDHGPARACHSTGAMISKQPRSMRPRHDLIARPESRRRIDVRNHLVHRASA